ncbi:AAA domain-containing protein [Nannocystis pusilla]|uniref:AAA domain-containing protein n=1 Tax=Nannocystis pusilla TaxID=889268 RepID=UPI003B7B0BFE
MRGSGARRLAVGGRGTADAVVRADRRDAQRHRRAAHVRRQGARLAGLRVPGRAAGLRKTTAICEIVQQLVSRGQRVLLCASTHFAIDNVLERLLDSGAAVDAVRIGKLDKVDDKVRACQLDARIEALIDAWKRLPRCAGSATPSCSTWPSGRSSWPPT